MSLPNPLLVPFALSVAFVNQWTRAIVTFPSRPATLPTRRQQWRDSPIHSFCFFIHSFIHSLAHHFWRLLLPLMFACWVPVRLCWAGSEADSKRAQILERKRRINKLSIRVSLQIETNAFVLFSYSPRLPLGFTPFLSSVGPVIV